MDWKEGSPEKIALHALVGGIMAEINDGSFGEGMTVGAINELLIAELSKLKGKDNKPLVDTDVMQLVSSIVGKAIGGNSGAVIAESATKNNYLTHAQEAQRQQAIRDGDQEAIEFWNDLDAAQDQMANILFPGISLEIIKANPEMHAAVYKAAVDLKIPTVSLPEIPTAAIVTTVVIAGVTYVVVKHADKLVKIISPAGAAVLGQSFDKMGTYVRNPNISVNWDIVVTHAIKRMNERGVTVDMINLWVTTGKVLQQADGKHIFIAKEGAVVLDRVGKVVTTYSRAHYDEKMLEIVKQLFGS